MKTGALTLERPSLHPNNMLMKQQYSRVLPSRQRSQGAPEGLVFLGGPQGRLCQPGLSPLGIPVQEGGGGGPGYGQEHGDFPEADWLGWVTKPGSRMELTGSFFLFYG